MFTRQLEILVTTLLIVVGGNLCPLYLVTALNTNANSLLILDLLKIFLVFSFISHYITSQYQLINITYIVHVLTNTRTKTSQNDKYKKKTYSIKHRLLKYLFEKRARPILKN